jgi:hypothetical protein
MIDMAGDGVLKLSSDEHDDEAERRYDADASTAAGDIRRRSRWACIREDLDVDGESTAAMTRLH